MTQPDRRLRVLAARVCSARTMQRLIDPVTIQIAITVALLVGAGLLMQNFVRVAARDLHFNADKLLAFELNLPTTDYLRRQGTVAGLPYFEIGPSPAIAFERVYRGLRDLPNVESVAGVSVGLINSLVVPSAIISREPAAGAALDLPPSLTIGVGTSMHVSYRRPLTAVYFLVTPTFFTSMKMRRAMSINPTIALRCE